MVEGTITIPTFTDAGSGARHFFGTRLQSDPIEGRKVTRASAEPVCLVSVQQVHGTDVLVVDRPTKAEESFPGGWDALLTNRPGVLLTVRTADCVPVLVHDPVHKAVGAIHAGWRGAVAGIVPRTLEMMQCRFGSKPDSLQVGIGPSIGPCCYEVDEPVLRPLRAGFPGWRLVVREIGQGRALLDLRELVRRQAQAAGVGTEAIRTVNVCTACHPELFYSYRRDGKVNRTMVSGIMLPRPSARRS